MALQSTTPIATITLQQSTFTVTFSGIPNTYRDLILVITGGTDSGDRNIQISFNSDTTNSNYAAVQMSGTGSSADGVAIGPTQTRYLNYYGYFQTNLNTIIQTQIFDYAITNKHKTYLTRASSASNGVAALASRWANTNAITSIAINVESANFATNSTLSLYGRVA